MQGLEELQTKLANLIHGLKSNSDVEPPLEANGHMPAQAAPPAAASGWGQPSTTVNGTSGGWGSPVTSGWNV
jgi:DNA-directed RNA polymerase II subunit RPB3